MDPFATPSELATYLQTATQAEADAGATDVLDTGLALQMLEAASATIRGICGWSITEETVTAVARWDWWRTSVLFLPTLRLTALSLQVGAQVLVNQMDYAWSEEGVIQFLRRQPGGLINGPILTPLSMTYTHGFDPAPDIIKAVCLELAAAKMELVSPRQLVSSTVDGVTDVYGRGGMAAYDPSLELRLSAYRLPAVA